MKAYYSLLVDSTLMFLLLLIHLNKVLIIQTKKRLYVLGTNPTVLNSLSFHK